jgi:hypothetical protein
MKVRRWIGKKGGAGLVSALAPVVIGVTLAYAWNATGATPPSHDLPGFPAPSPFAGIAADHAGRQGGQQHPLRARRASRCWLSGRDYWLSGRD